MRLLVFAAATILTGSLYAADPELVSLAPPDTKVMAGINVEQVRLSPLGQYLLAQNAQAPDIGLQKLIATSGFDPRQDLREILVSSNGQQGAASSSLALARGTFDVPKILEAARAFGATVETYSGVSIAVSKQVALAFPDSTLAIAGDPVAVRAAIDRKSAPTAINSALAVQVNQLSTTEDAWIVTLAMPSNLQSGPLAMASKVQQATSGVKLGANVVLTLRIVSETDQDASSLEAVLKALPGMAQMSAPKGELAQVVALLNNLNVTSDGPVTKVSLSVPETQIEQMIQAAQSSAPHPQASNGADATVRALPPARTAAAPPFEGPAPQRIRVGANVQKAKLLQHPEPVYPPLAMQARISGVVRLNAIIGKDGTVQKVTLVSGHPLLAPPAMEAVRQWVYQPTLLNGQAVEVVTQVEVNFDLRP